MKTKELDKIKKKLPRGYRMILWKRLDKYSISTIDSVLRGDFNNEIILDTAIQLAEEYQNTIKERLEKINSL